MTDLDEDALRALMEEAVAELNAVPEFIAKLEDKEPSRDMVVQVAAKINGIIGAFAKMQAVLLTCYEEMAD